MPERQPDLPTRLILTYSSRQSHNQAVELADTFTNGSDRTRLFSHLGSNAAQAGIDPTPFVDYLTEAVRTGTDSYGDHRRQAIYGLTRVFLAMDKPQDAYQVSLRDGYYGRPAQPYTDLRIARALHKQGQDPLPPIQRSLSHVGQVVVGDGRTSKVHRDEWGEAGDYSLIAQTQHEIGLDPKPLLTKGYEVALKQTSWKPHALSFVAEGYAATGDLKRALEIIDEIQENKPEPGRLNNRKSETLDKIARDQSTKGNAKGALMVARRKKDNLFTATIAADSAIRAAEKGERPMDLIETALRYVSRPLRLYRRPGSGEGYSDYDRARQAEVYALVARAKHLTGEDSSPLFAQALEVPALLEEDNHLTRASIYNETARNQALAGLGATPTWRLAYESGDQHFKLLGEKQSDWWEVAEYMLDLEAMAKIQIECGYFDLARETIAKIEALDSSIGGSSALFKAETLSDLALTQARRGLTSEELKSLTPEQIQAVPQEDNPTAKQALTYFGLTQ